MVVRGTVAMLTVAALMLAVLCIWIVLVDGDDRVPPGGVRTGAVNIPGQPASASSAFTLCGPSRVLPLSC
jgi:hypothetical protein